MSKYLLSKFAYPKVVINRIKTTTLIGGVVGGVAGGLLILAIGALFYFLQRKSRRTRQMQTQDYILSPYSPEPFVDTRPTSENVSKWGSGHSATPLFSLTSSEMASMSPSGSGSGGYYRTSDFGSRFDPPSEVPSSPQREPWDVGSGTGVIQHEDSGVTLLPPSERRIVELPPRYDNIGTSGRPSLEVLLESQNPI